MKKVLPIAVAVAAAVGAGVAVVVTEHVSSASSTCRAEVSSGTMAVYANITESLSPSECASQIQTASSDSTSFTVSQISTIPPNMVTLCSNSKVTVYASSMVAGELQLQGDNPESFCAGF